jgi:hypothetical protein
LEDTIGSDLGFIIRYHPGAGRQDPNPPKARRAKSKVEESPIRI